MAFQKAQRKKAKARIGICGPAGSGKTMSALRLAFGLGGKVAVIDTEHGSAELYAHLGEYDVATITPPFEPEKYIALMKDAEAAGYDTIILDSLSHAWAGEGGLLEFVDKRSAAGNKFAAWRDATPKHNKLIDAILQSRCHVIATMRSKTEYVVEENERGKSVPKKVGMAPVQREGMDYEFTIVFDVEQTKHVATVSKDRTDLFNGFCDTITEAHGQKIRAWLDGGVEAPVAPPAAHGYVDQIRDKLLTHYAGFDADAKQALTDITGGKMAWDNLADYPEEWLIRALAKVKEYIQGGPAQ